MTLRRSTRTAVELTVLAAVAGYARRASDRAQARTAKVLDRTGRLAEANELLSSLHEVAQGLPSSLDLHQVLESTVTTLRSIWDVTASAVLVPDETSERWIAVHRQGVRVPYLLAPAELPPGLARATTSRRAFALSPLGGEDMRGLAPGSRSGLYTPLYARDRLVGMLAVEHPDAGYFGARDVRLLDGFAETAALVLDNARWFARLRTLGAEAERSRIAGALHDRVGQSLAALSFELDLLGRHSPDEELRPGIEKLRKDLRRAMAEIRDTLYELRTDVSEDRGLETTLDSYLVQVGRRTDVKVHADITGGGARLPLLQEREMWRIAQEAVMNAERHAGAKEIAVTWHYDGVHADLEVLDDGCGFEATNVPSGASGGLVQMRERAASIGAALEVESAPGRGTCVRCSLGASS